MARQTLESWIREALMDPEKESAPTAMSLVHKDGTGNEREIYSVKFSAARKWTEVSLAALFKHKAEGYSQDLTGVQTFCLIALYPVGEDVQEARWPFTITGRLGYDAHGLMTEGPSETGKTQQNMRLTEAIVQGSFRQNANTHETLLRATDQLSGLVGKLIVENGSLMDALKVLALEKAQNAHTFTLEQMRIQRENTYIDHGLKVLPGLVNNLTGKKFFPESVVNDAIFEKVAGELDEEKLRQLQSMFTQETWVMIVQKLTDAMAKGGESNGTPKKLEG